MEPKLQHMVQINVEALVNFGCIVYLIFNLPEPMNFQAYFQKTLNHDVEA